MNAQCVVSLWKRVANGFRSDGKHDRFTEVKEKGKFKQQGPDWNGVQVTAWESWRINGKICACVYVGVKLGLGVQKVCEEWKSDLVRLSITWLQGAPCVFTGLRVRGWSLLVRVLLPIIEGSDDVAQALYLVSTPLIQQRVGGYWICAHL